VKNILEITFKVINFNHLKHNLMIIEELLSSEFLKQFKDSFDYYFINPIKLFYFSYHL